MKGRPFTIDAEGMLARVVQHEFDHLRGILFIDKLPEAKKQKLLKLYQKKQRV
jgi:peptide deformylase